VMVRDGLVMVEGGSAVVQGWLEGDSRVAR